MPLFLIGIGLGNEKDITLRGLELLQASDVVYLESYTAIMCDPECQGRMRALYGKELIVADRYFVEDGTALLQAARESSIALLVVGDPFSATTHSDLYVRCRTSGIPVQVVHNASIMNAVGFTGLQLYRFGHTITLCFWTDTWKPDSWYDAFVANRERGLHTLVLLDIKVKEVSDDNLARGKLHVFEPPRFMSCMQAAQQLLAVGLKKEDSVRLGPSIRVVGIARLGFEDQVVVPCSLQELADMDPATLGRPLHSVVIPGDIHECEAEHLATFAKK